MVYQILQTISPESLVTIKKFVDLDSLGKKKRVYRKVIGFKQGENVIEAEHNVLTASSSKTEDLEDDSEDDVGPKRLRTKIKT